MTIVETFFHLFFLWIWQAETTPPNQFDSHQHGRQEICPTMNSISKEWPWSEPKWSANRRPTDLRWFSLSSSCMELAHWRHGTCSSQRKDILKTTNCRQIIPAATVPCGMLRTLCLILVSHRKSPTFCSTGSTFSLILGELIWNLFWKKFALFIF